MRSQPQGKNPTQTNLIGKNWITRFLNRHPELALKFSGRIDRQRAYASSPCTHFRKLKKVIRENDTKGNGITNVDEKGFVKGISPLTRCITKRGRKNPRVKLDGKREFITALEAVSADDFVFPSFLIAKGAKHCFDWYKNVHAEDEDTYFAVPNRGWTDNVMAMHWCDLSRQYISIPNHSKSLVLTLGKSQSGNPLAPEGYTNHVAPFAYAGRIGANTKRRKSTVYPPTTQSWSLSITRRSGDHTQNPERPRPRRNEIPSALFNRPGLSQPDSRAE